MSEAAAAAGFNRLLSDDRLTRRAVGGDERAFAAIFRRYHQSLYRFCLAIVGNPEDAQDALQNTMAKVLAALPGEEREIELKPWLYRIAHNESIDLLRRRRDTRELDAEQAAPGQSLAEDVVTRERLRGLLADLRELPERQREVLVMREMAGLGFEEIAVALGTSGAVARQTLYEARQSLSQMEDGREMNCEVATRALSDGDGRVTRRRDIRAHLRSCAECRRFREEIDGRERDLAALSPLPAVAAAGMLHGLVGGSQAAGGLAAALGGGAAKTVAGSALAKGVATAAVVAAVGVTAADRTGVVHLGLPGGKSGKSSTTQPGASGDPASGATGGAAGYGGERSGNGGANRATPGAAPGANAAPAGREHGQGAAHANPQAETKSQGAGEGVGSEKEKPSAAAGGQETAAGHKPESVPGEGGGKGSGQAAAPGKPSAPPTPEAPDPPTKGPPENPPQGAAPSPPPPAHQPSPPAGGAEPPVVGSASNPGLGGEKGRVKP